MSPLLLLCRELASASYLMAIFKPHDEPGAEAATLDAAASFCLAAMRLVTAELDSLSARTTDPVVLDSEYVSYIFETVHGLMHTMQGVLDSSGERLVQLLRSPNIRGAVRVVTSVWYARTLMPSTSGSMGVGNASDAVAVAAAAAAQRQACFGWQAAARGCTPLQPPQQQRQQEQQQERQHFDPCQQATGCSLHAAAWAAALLDSTGVTEAALVVIKSTAAMADQFVDAFKQQQRRQQQQQHMTSIMAQADEVLLLLQLLLCSLEQAPDLLGRHYIECAVRAANATVNAINLPNSSVEAATAGLQGDEPAGNFAAAASAAAVPAGQEAAVTQALAQLSGLMGFWSGYMLPTFLALLQQQTVSICTAQAAADSSSSSRYSSRATERGSARSIALAESARASAADSNLLVVLGMLAVAAEYAPPMLAGVVQSASLRTLLRTSWSRHCKHICAALDSCFRLQSGSSGGLRDASTACRLVQGLGLGLLRKSGPIEAAAVHAGPGSAQQKQLFSMLVSVLKVCRALSAGVGVGASPSERLSLQQAAGEGCIQTALTAVSCLSDRCDPLPDAHSSTGGMAACDAAGTSAVAASAAGQTEVAAAPATAAATPVNSLPALVLCGRCCLQWASQLHVLQQQSPDLGELLLLQFNTDRPAGAAELLQVPQQHATCVVFFAWPQTLAARVLQACRDWLSRSGTTEALAAAGYPAETLLQELGVLLELLGQPAARDAAAALAVYGQVVQQLKAVGLAFNTLAFYGACNNPFCSNMSGATELESVSGCATKCVACRVAHYCSRACQKAHWQQHKPVCKALKVAAVS